MPWRLADKLVTQRWPGCAGCQCQFVSPQHGYRWDWVERPEQRETECLLPVSLLKKVWRSSDAAARPIWMCKCKLMLIRIFHEAELGAQVSTTQILFPLNLLGSWQTQQQQRCYGRTLHALTFQLFACCVTRCILLGPGASQDAGGKPR